MSSTILHNPENKKSRFMGLAATILLHALAFVLCFKMIFINSTAALPLSRMEILIEPEQTEIKVKQFEIKPSVTGKKIEETPPVPAEKAEIDDQSGDVEVPVEKPVPAKIDERSLFRSDDVGKTADNASGAHIDSRTLFPGDNNPEAGASDEVPSADVIGRHIDKMEQPANTSNREGRVVVEIMVDQRGKVTKAQARARGTTIQDATLWKAAEEAARKTTFNTDFNSPPLQMGTITYVFRLK
jgi:TonB family protein